MRFFRILAVTVFALFAIAAHADGVNALTHFYDNVETLSAHFSQKQYDSDDSLMRQSTGVFLLSRPDQFRWQYKKPYEQIMVSNGKVFKFYDVDLAQVTIRPVTESLRATPARLLTGGIGLKKAFKVTAEGTHDKMDWLRLEPRADDSDFKQIRLGMQDGLPKVMELDDRLGQTTHIRFSDIKVNPKLDAQRFDIDVPDDVTVVDERKGDAH